MARPSRLIDTRIGTPPFYVAFVNSLIGNDSTGQIITNNTQTIIGPVFNFGNGYFRTIDAAYGRFINSGLPEDKRVICKVDQSMFNPSEGSLNENVYQNIIFTTTVLSSFSVDPSTYRGVIFVAAIPSGSSKEFDNCSFQSITFRTSITSPRTLLLDELCRIIDCNVSSVRIIQSEDQLDVLETLEMQLIVRGDCLIDDIEFDVEANPIVDNFSCLVVNGSISGSFPNLSSQASKDIIIIEGSTDSNINFDGNSVDDNDITIDSNGGVAMIKLVDPNPTQTKVFMEDFNFNIDTKDNRTTALFMTQGNIQQIDGLFDIEECNFTSEEPVNFNNTSSALSLYNNFDNLNFINNRAEAEEELNSDLIEFIDNEAPINYSMIDLSFHSTVSQFYIPGTIDKSIKLEVNDRFIYYVNAKDNNILIELPSGGSEVEGKMLIFKRIDSSVNRVTLISEDGRVENKKRLRLSNNFGFPAVTLHFHERNWWILSAFSI